MIHEVAGLGSLTQLETLDLADNDITKVQNLACLPCLKTLNLSGNKLHTAEDIAELQQCSSLTSLDLSSNKLANPAALDVLLPMPLALLRLTGNPLVGSTRYAGSQRRLQHTDVWWQSRLNLVMGGFQEATPQWITAASFARHWHGLLPTCLS